MTITNGMYGIESVPNGTPGALTCGECGSSWMEDITPAGRCPWEYDHDHDDDDDDARMFDPAPDGWEDYELVNKAQESASIAAHQCYDCGQTFERAS